jgi:iron complex outermembrane receptor protein
MFEGVTMKFDFRIGFLLGASLSTLSILMAAPALAQVAGVVADSGATDGLAPGQEVGSTSGDIIVTAQKRRERLQNVPVSVAVIDGRQLQNEGGKSIQDLTGSVTGVTFVHGGTDRLFVRGVGSGDSPGFDQAVATFIDGIYHGRRSASQATVFDIDRIEVLKGPQAILFGNSAIAGAVNTSTTKPGDETRGYLSSSYNFNFNEYRFEGALGGGLTDTLSMRVSGFVSQGDGWLINTADDDRRIPASKNKAARAQLRWQPTNNLTVSLKGEVAESLNDGAPLELYDCPVKAPFTVNRGYCLTAIAAGQDTIVNRRAAISKGTHSNVYTKEAVLTADYELAGSTLTSITGLYYNNWKTQLDVDLTAQDLFVGGNPEKYSQFSQELRVASSAGSRFEYVAGLYYQHDCIRSGQRYTYYDRQAAFLTPARAALTPYMPLGQQLSADQNTDTYAGFAALTYRVTSKLKATASARIQSVEKSLDKVLFFGTGPGYSDAEVIPFPVALQALARTFTDTIAPTLSGSYSQKGHHASPAFKLQYDANPDLMFYSGYSNGWQAGGFNFSDATASQANVAFGPETVDAYEVGFKSQFLNRRLTVNVAIFRSDYKDLQVGGARQQVNGPPISIIQNAGTSRSQGIELESRWAVTDRLTSTLSLGYLDAKYRSFPNASVTSAQSQNIALTGDVITLRNPTTGVPAAQDLSGRPTMYSPKFSGSWAVDYRMTLSDRWDVIFGGKAFYSDKYYPSASDDPLLKQSSFATLDLSARLVDQRGKWSLALLSRNVTNTLYTYFAGVAPSSTGSFTYLAQPGRSFSLQFRKDF